MALATYIRAVAGVLAVLGAAAQQCYYPNGNRAPSEKPCSSAAGSACCPDKWQCMTNGLCYYPPDNLYGRYSCTDRSWTSPGCPSNLCTYDMSAAGGESITQCSDHNNDWCCNADAVHVDCCKESPSPRPFFMLQDPVAYATVGGRLGSSAPNLAFITGKALSDGGNSSPTTTPRPSSVRSSGSSSGLTTAVTSVSTSISSGSAGITTIIITNIIQPPTSETANPSSSSEGKPKVGLIVGCAVGIPLALALLGILIWLFRKRTQQKNASVPPYTSSETATGAAALHKLSNSATKFAHTHPGMSELGNGQGIGPERPVSTIAGKAEMASGADFAPGTTPLAPHLMGVGGGNHSSWGSAPPYPESSPQSHHLSWVPGHSQQSSLDSTALGQQATGGASVAAGAGMGAPPGGYVAYRSPPNHNLPDVAELPAGPAELGDPSPPALMETRGFAENPPANASAGAGAGAGTEHPGIAGHAEAAAAQKRT